MNALNPIITNNYNYDLPVFRAHDPYNKKPNGQPIDIYPSITSEPLTVIKKGAKNANTNVNLDFPAEHLLIVVPGIGDIVFINLHDHHLDDYKEVTKGEFGVLMRYRGAEVYFRYEGTDVILNPWTPIISINSVGTLYLHKMLIGGTRNKATLIKTPEFNTNITPRKVDVVTPPA